MTDDPNLRYNDLLEITRLPLSIANAECMNADLDPGFAENGFAEPGFAENNSFENEMLMNININHKAPEFTLHDENGNDVSLKGLKGKGVVLYFYPPPDTPGSPPKPALSSHTT